MAVAEATRCPAPAEAIAHLEAEATADLEAAAERVAPARGAASHTVRHVDTRALPALEVTARSATTVAAPGTATLQGTLDPAG